MSGLAELERGVTRATLGKSGPDAVRALCHAYRAFARHNPGLYAATVPAPANGAAGAGAVRP